MSDKKFRAFVSYSHHDRKWAGRLHRELERYRIPKHLNGADNTKPRIESGLRPIFRDQDELPSGADLSQLIKNALGDSESLIVICSPSAVASKWVNDEIRMFQSLGKGKRIFCFIVDGIPFSGDERECFPEALRNPVDKDGKLRLNPEEHIAANASGGKKEWQHAKLMLIAGLLGVGLDELLQRDLQRRNRNMFMVAAGSISIAVIMAALTVFAFLSQAEAERRQADADNLVGFLLGDLRQDLYAIGRVDLYSSVAEKAMEYFKSLENEDARDEILAQRAVALRQIGSALLERSDMQGAEKAFDESLGISRRLAEQNPERLDWSLALAESHFYVGEVHWQRGELEAARAAFKNQLSVVDSLAAAQPGNPDRLLNSGYAWTNYGRVLEKSGQYEEALQAYQTVMDIFQKLLVLQPGGLDAKLEVGFAHNNLGKLKTSLGRLDEADAHYRQDLKIKMETFLSDQSNSLWRGYLASSHFWLGKLLQIRGNLEEARSQIESALVLLDFLVINDPEGIDYRQRKDAVETQLAANCRISREMECASMQIESALADLAALTSANPNVARLSQDFAYSQLEAAWQAALQGKMEQAIKLANDAKQILNQLTEQTPLDHDVRKLEILTMLTLGDIAQQVAQPGNANYNWQLVLEKFNQNFEHSQDPQVMDLRARLLTRNGLMIEAQQIEAALGKIGYVSPFP